MEDVTLLGDVKIVVEDGWKMIVQEVNGKIVYLQEKLTKTPWYWTYSFDSDYTLQLQKVKN
ncbi:MAG: hypothetical protein JSS09_08025 [Verrucomicrobia bacterium]|nr:hypothetical protein [Verrucomicrobiota bacterium]